MRTAVNADPRDESGGSGNQRRRLRPRGGYRATASFQTATIIDEGGYSEQLATARLARRQTAPARTAPSNRAHPADPIPSCPNWGEPMALRTARAGANPGRQFWGCTAYPDCKGTVELRTY
jgi:hypothetical protein